MLQLPTPTNSMDVAQGYSCEFTLSPTLSRDGRGRFEGNSGAGDLDEVVEEGLAVAHAAEHRRCHAVHGADRIERAPLAQGRDDDARSDVIRQLRLPEELAVVVLHAHLVAMFDAACRGILRAEEHELLALALNLLRLVGVAGVEETVALRRHDVERILPRAPSAP